jgi:hypothetical protein
VPGREPDQVAYPAHAFLGRTLNRIGASPTAVGIQWVKAAAHARSREEMDAAIAGLRAAADRASPDERLEAILCEGGLRGKNQNQIAVISNAGIHCTPDIFNVTHVAEGTPIHYSTRPPIAGPHYPRPYPGYGVTEAPVEPGYWVHNLEHGAVVLLYQCPDSCPEVLADLRAFYDDIPAHPNWKGGEPRLLITPYADMDHRFAIIAWGHLMEMDEFNWTEVRGFFKEYVDRGPECRRLTCPSP